MTRNKNIKDKDFQEKIIEEYQNGITVSELAEKYKLGKTSIYRILKNNNIARTNIHAKGYTSCKKISPDDYQEIIKMYQEGMYATDIAQKYDVHKTTIRRLLRNHGIEIHRFIRKSQFSDEEVQDMYKLYEEGWTQKKISQKYNVDETEIAFLFKKKGYEMRDQSHAKRKYTLNENYFDEIDNQNKAYILGFLYADGCNFTSGSRISISIQERDRHILEDFQKELETDTPITFHARSNPKWQDVVNFIICNKHMSESLEKIGMVANKSLILEFPNLRDDLIPHFIRGYFDGDGHVSDKPGRYVATIVSTNNFCLRVQQILDEQGIYCKIYNTYNKETSTRDLRITRKLDVISFLDYIYNDANLFLKRKHDVYIKKYCA